MYNVSNNIHLSLGKLIQEVYIGPIASRGKKSSYISEYLTCNIGHQQNI